MFRKRTRSAISLSRRKFLTASAAALSMPAVLRHSRAFARQPVFKVGYSSALTGYQAATAAADPFVLGEMKERLGQGVDNNGRRVRIEIFDRDSESINGARNAEDLVYGEGVDLIAATSAPNTVIPVADLAEINGVPCVTTDSPWQPVFFGRGGDPDVGFEWTYHFNWGIDDTMAALVALWSGADVERIVGGVYPQSSHARNWIDPERGLPPRLEKAGFAWVQAPLYQSIYGLRAEPGGDIPSDFFVEQVEVLKAAGCAIVTGNMATAEIARFLDRAAALDYRPKIATITRGLIFPRYIAALGDRADRMSTEVWWSPHFPYRSSLTGQTAHELADAYTAATGRPWTMSLGTKHALFEVIADVVRRAEDLDDRYAIVDALAKTRLDTVVGPIEWTGDPVKNVARTPVVTGQWQKIDGEFQLVIVDNVIHPEIPVGGALQYID